MFQFTDLLLLCLIFLLLAYWWSAQGIRQIALNSAKRHCQDMDVQMLDGSIALYRIWLRRDEQGKMRFWRSYAFEFTSTGVERYRGQVVLLGRNILSIQLEPHRI